jgi:formate dehydrogenase major subunit
MNTINLTIDNKKINVPEGTNLVDAAKTADIDIPTLCYRKELKPFTSCFICVVEVKGMKNLVPACSTVVSEGMEVLTNSEEIRSTRKLCVELLISEHFGDCVSPCRIECPADCDIQGYLTAIGRGDANEAVKLIKETISLPSSIGRVCPRPCESACRRARKEGAASICSLKRFAGDKDLESNKPYKPEVKADTGKKVAIIGAGPAGLNAAYYLKQQGHSVTIFESKPVPGGMLQFGIPEYRLPKEILQKEIKNILSLGIDIKYNVTFGKDITIDTLKKDGYSAFLIAVGAQIASGMRVDGEETEGVIGGIYFLDKIVSGEKYDLGKKVIVVGGGNTAIDCARTSLRLGSDTTIVYRRTKKEMPAETMEIHASDEEEIKMKFLTAPVKIRKENNKLIMECIKMQLGEPDESGRRRPVAIPGSEFEMEADTIISAIGQKVDSNYSEKIGLAVTSWKTIKTNEKTGQTNIENIFAAGDCVLGPDIASAALGTGKAAAASINQYLNGEKIKGLEKLFRATMGPLEDIPEEFYKDVENAKRNSMPELEPKVRVSNFEEVELGFSEDQSLEESSICLECGCVQAKDCLLRDLATEYDCEPERWSGDHKAYYIDNSHPEISFESHKCILCGCCVRYSREIKNQDVMGFVDRGFHTEIRPAFGKPLGSLKFDYANDLAERCPTGAIALKKK